MPKVSAHVSALAAAAALATLASPAKIARASPAAAGGIKDLAYLGFGADAESILAGDDFNYGLPVRLFERIARERGYDAETMWRVLGSVPSPPGRETQGLPLPVSDSVFERGGARLLNVNCFSCHAGVVAGRVVAGLGSSHIDGGSFAASSKELIETWDNPLGRVQLGIYLSPEEMRALRGFIEHQRTIVVPSLQAKARGEIHGPWVVWRHIARMRDPSEGMETYGPLTKAPLERLLDRPLPPVDPSPWWNLRYKTRAFWTRDVTLDSLPTFALNLMDPSPENTATFPERMERTSRQLAFARKTEAPAYPWPDEIDREMAATGRALYHGERALADGTTLPCAGCHGTYGEAGELTSYPERGRIDLAVVGTDPAYASILHDELKPLYEHFARSRFIARGSADAVYPETAGYEPPPLKGIWASAPYFHNGSVPTLASVLNSKARPRHWRRSLDPFAYDRARVGLRYDEVEGEELARLEAFAAATGDGLSEAALARRRVYSTADFGRGNGGHTFGDRMSEAERRAVIEFLKTL